MTSASETSMGTLRTWRTREGPQGVRSPLYVVLSLPLAANKNKNQQTNISGDSVEQTYDPNHQGVKSYDPSVWCHDQRRSSTKKCDCEWSTVQTWASGSELWSLMALWWSVTEQEEVESQTPFVTTWTGREDNESLFPKSCVQAQYLTSWSWFGINLSNCGRNSRTKKKKVIWWITGVWVLAQSRTNKWKTGRKKPHWNTNVLKLLERETLGHWKTHKSLTRL